MKHVNDDKKNRVNKNYKKFSFIFNRKFHNNREINKFRIYINNNHIINKLVEKFF